MTPQEAQIIRDVFARIRSMGPGPADPEALKAVEAELLANPSAGLGLVKVVVGLERERDELAQQAADLSAQIEQMQAQRAPQGGGLFGSPAPASSWGRGVPQSGPWDQPQQQPAGPWGNVPMQAPQPQQPQGSGFWGSALRTGAGVAGGLFAFEALKGMFGGGHGAEARETGGHGLFDRDTAAPERSDDREAANEGGFGGEQRHDVASGQDFVADDIDFIGGGSDDDFA